MDSDNDLKYVNENLKEYLLVLEFDNAKQREKINTLENEKNMLIEENNRLKKENSHFKSTKAYKIWKKYAKIKDKD